MASMRRSILRKAKRERERGWVPGTREWRARSRELRRQGRESRGERAAITRVVPAFLAKMLRRQARREAAAGAAK